MTPNENNGLTIYCCYHQDEQKQIDDNNTIWFDARQDPLNSYISEFAMFRWIYENDKESKYIGTCHYRRRIFETDFDQKIFDEGGCQIYNAIQTHLMTRLPWGVRFSYDLKRYLSSFILNQYWMWQNYEDYVTKKYGENNKYLKLDEDLREKRFEFIQYSCGILDRKHFMDMCDYILGFLDYIDKKYNLNYSAEKYEQFIVTKFGINYQAPEFLNWFHYKRYLGYIFEKMYSNYILVNIPTYKEIESDGTK